MKTKRNRIVGCLVVILCLGLSIPAPVEAAVQIVSYSVDLTRADTIVWKYKSINGQVYKRKYNETKGIWIGDWIMA